MKSMLVKIKEWLAGHQSEVALTCGVFLISLLSFAMGYIVAKKEGKEPITVQQSEDSSSCQIDNH